MITEYDSGATPPPQPVAVATAPGSDLLASRVVAAGGGKLGLLASAYASPAGPIVATLASNVKQAQPRSA